MKKLLSLLVVAAIVTSAFAFTTKNMGLSFCVRNPAGSACEILRDVVPDPLSVSTFFHFPYDPQNGKWDGLKQSCINASPTTDCAVSIKLDID